MSQTNEQSNKYRIGLDKVIDQRNRVVAMDVPDLACSDMRDAFVLTLDVLVHVLIEHFPLMYDTKNDPAEVSR